SLRARPPASPRRVPVPGVGEWELARRRISGRTEPRKEEREMSTVENRIVPTSAFESAGPVTAHLFEAVRSIWDAQLEHPFGRGLADGTLEEARFKNGVRQDYVYLREYARIFAWAVAKATDLETMGW